MTSESKQNTLENILLAAQHEFSVAGFDGASIERIAREANVTKQLIYHYFQTKDQLYKMTLESMAGSMALPLDADVYRQLAVDEAMALVIRRITEEYVKNASYAALTLDQSLHHGAHITERSQFIPNMRFVNAEIVQPILERGIRAGEFSPELDTRFAYCLIFQIASGCFLNSNVMSQTVDVDFDSEAGIEEWRMAATDFVLHALRNK